MIDNASLLYGFLLAHHAPPTIMNAFKVLVANKSTNPDDWIGGIKPEEEFLPIEPISNRCRGWTRKQSELVINLRKEGATLAEIAREIKRTPGAVAVQLSKLGVKRKLG